AGSPSRSNQPRGCRRLLERLALAASAEAIAALSRSPLGGGSGRSQPARWVSARPILPPGGSVATDRGWSSTSGPTGFTQAQPVWSTAVSRTTGLAIVLPSD